MRTPRKTTEREGEEGLTLIEVLMAGAIGGILLTALSVSTGVFLDHYATGVDEQKLSIEHHMALDRMLRSISGAEDVAVDSSSILRLTFPDGGTERYAWSGAPGDPLVLSVDGGAGNPLVGGVVNLDFSPVMGSTSVESDEITHDDLLDFESYSGYPQTTEDHLLGTGAVHGLTFSILWNDAIEKIVLTDIALMVGKLPGETADLKITLKEGLFEWVPRPWDDAIASFEIPNSEIPDAHYSGSDLVIGWMNISLPEQFTVQPNRFYCILLEPANGAEAGYLRVAKVTSSYGPINNMVYIGSTDGGVTWDPPFVIGAYTLKDTPIHLNGDVYAKSQTPIVYVRSMEVSLEIASGGKEVDGFGKAMVRGGGQR